MPGFLRKIWHSLSDKLSAILRFVYFRFIPRRRWQCYSVITLVFVFTLVVGSGAFAAESVGDQILTLLNNVLFYICQMLGWVVLKIFALVILISSYNEFVTSSAVTKGWTLLRDVCNLFLVLILLAVAFAMILRVKIFGSTQMLFTVIKAAVLINFSKLVCGLIIDFAQVVMMTFVNGYAATAGANLVEGLGLSKLMAFPAGGADKIIEPFDIFLTLWIAIFILIMTAIVTFFILLLLLLRIVQLWILVVLSPLAFTAPAIPVKKFQSMGGQWWDTFTGTVMVGPLMAFFLWLSLLVMSNPQDLMIKDTGKLEAASPNTNKNIGVTTLPAMTQAAIGLVMLMASLMVAKQAGGVVGSMGSKMADATTKAAKSIAGRMSGYSQVKERGAAVGAGWSARSKEKKQMAMAKYSRIGEAAFAKKEGAIATGKKGVSALPGTAANLLKAGRNLLTGKKGTLQADMKQTWKRAQRAGGINDVVKDSIEQDHEAKRRAEAEKSLDVRGIKSPDDLRGAMMDKSENKDVRKAAALKLKGKYESADDAKMAKSLVAGDRKSATEFDDAMDKDQAHLVYDMKDDKQKGDFIKKIKAGKITLGSQKEDFFESQEHLQLAMEALGPEKFNAQMQGVVKKGSVMHQDAIKGTLQNLNGEIVAGDKEMKLRGFPADSDFAKDLQKKKDMAKPMRGAMATVTSNLADVFKTTDAAGKEDVMHDELKAHLKYASGKDLAKKDIKEKDPGKAQLSDKVLEDLAAVVSQKQLKDMAVSKTEGAATKVEIVVKQVLENYNNEKAKRSPDITVVTEYENRLADIASQSAITDCVSDATIQKALAPFKVAPKTKPKPKRRTATGGSSRKKGSSGGSKRGKKKTP